MTLTHAWKTSLTSNRSTAQEQLGVLRTEWSSTDSCFKTYKYVSVASDTTVANGTALTYTDVLGQVASSDESDGDQNQVCGVGIGAITASYYGWVQVSGYHSAVITNGDDDIADGDTLILSTTDGTVDSVASATASTHSPVGIAVTADVDGSNTVAAQLCCV